MLSRRLIYSFVLVSLLFMLPMAMAQPALRATGQLYFDTDALKPGQQAIAAIVVEIEEGYHAQSSQPLDENLIPFTAKLTGEGATIDLPLYPPGIVEDFPALGGKLSVYEKTAIVFIPFTVPADAKPGEVKFTAKAKMQLCNAEVCEAPGSLTMTQTLKIGAADSVVKSTHSDIFKQFDPLKYLNKHEVAPAATTGPAAPVSKVDWIHYSDEALAKLLASGKPFIVKFTAAWCVNCHVVERRVFGDSATIEELSKRGVALVKVDLTQDGAPGSELLGRLNPSRSIPFTAVYFPGKSDPSVLTGIYSSADLLARLDDGGKTKTSTTTIFGYELATAPLIMKIGVAVAVGLLLNAVPCVLPVLPIKAMSFYEDANHSRSRSLLNGLFFSAGIVTTFGVLALFVITQNALWGKFISHPITAAGLAIVLLIAAAQAFGLFEFVLPKSVMNLESKANGASLVSNFFSGILIAILSTPCTIGVFAAVIAVAISAGSGIGSLILMFVGVGMALPWLILSGFPEATARFPRTGPWPSVVKQMTAFLLVGTAIFFAAPLMPAAFRESGLWWLIFACVAASALYLMVRTLQIAPRFRPIAVSSFISVVLVGTGLFLTLQLVA